ncbi:AAA family ATPase [Shouchella miscanthi]|uniref:AAA family ATPase n=1 Tax=Shouchella miscanthi TaxID=2598861 RepID=A0ABU6NNZ4_9BACI|nr:AAA family ATPase [Shouchella miscanthi]MED4129830.1 AAA family ATPase [Shouchella miscanthi]
MKWIQFIRFDLIQYARNRLLIGFSLLMGLIASSYLITGTDFEGYYDGFNRAVIHLLNVNLYLLPLQSSLIFMDEPTNGLDPYWVVRMKEMVEELKEQGKTIILSTHTLSFVEDLADSILFLQKGSLLIQSSLNELRSEMKGRSLEQFVYETIAEKELGCKK